jgi:hypothetical protein
VQKLNKVCGECAVKDSGSNILKQGWTSGGLAMGNRGGDAWEL